MVPVARMSGAGKGTGWENPEVLAVGIAVSLSAGRASGDGAAVRGRLDLLQPG